LFDISSSIGLLITKVESGELEEGGQELLQEDNTLQRDGGRF